MAEVRVRHRYLGPGSLIRWERGGRIGLVSFDHGRVMDVRRQDLSPLLDRAPMGRGVRLSPSDVTLPAAYGAGDRYLVEAFRLGIVPAAGIREWTYGRDGEMSYLEEWMADANEGAIYLFGDYGSGKTHLLHAMASRSLDRGWAVGFVPLDPLDHPPSRPKRVYQGLLRSLRWLDPDGQERDARDLLLTAVDKGLSAADVRHPVARPFLQRLEKGRDDEQLWRWFLGEDILPPGRLQRLHDHTTSSNIYSNLLDWWGRLARDHLGLKGLALLLDEAEMVTAVRWHRQVHRGLNFLVGLSRTACGHQDLINEPTRKDQRLGVRTGERTGLVYSGHLPLPYTTGAPDEPSALKVIFAVTPTELTRNLVETHDFDAMDIEPIAPTSLEALFDDFSAHYCRIYDIKPDHRDLTRIRQAVLGDLETHQVQRRFMKGMVEGLDFLRFHPRRRLDSLLGRDPFDDPFGMGRRW